MTLIPLRPSVPNNFPAIPGVCFMFSPTIATVARPPSAFIGEISPISISLANSSFSTSHASSASSFLTPIEVEFSEEACETKKTLMPFSANVLKIRWFTPMTPTMPKPVMVIKQVSLIDEIPLIGFEEWSASCFTMVPGASGLNVFFIRIGIFL